MGYMVLTMPSLRIICHFWASISFLLDHSVDYSVDFGVICDVLHR